MRALAALVAAVALAALPARALATSPSEEMDSQLKEAVEYERPSFEPMEVQVDGARLTIMDATIESHPLEDDTTIVRVTMRARRGQEPARVSRAVLLDRGGSSYSSSYVSSPSKGALRDEGFKVYNFRLPKTEQEELKSLEVTVASAKARGEPASTKVELPVGEQIGFADLDDARFGALSAFLVFTTAILAAASGI